MAHGSTQSFDAVIASATTTSAAVDLGRGYARVYVDIAGAVSTDVSFQAAPPTTSGAGSYRFVRHPIASGVTAPGTALVGSACSGYLVEVPALAGHRYVKVVARSAVDNGATIKLVCADM